MKLEQILALISAGTEIAKVVQAAVAGMKNLNDLDQATLDMRLAGLAEANSALSAELQARLRG